MELKYDDNIAVRYHKIFDYKLTKEEAIKWQYKNQKTVIKGGKSETRLQREKYSQKKLVIARKAANLISRVPTVLFVGVTGSLAMMNAAKDSDIDLLIITKTNMLWSSRLLVYFVLRTMHYVLRKPQIENERDALCLNMWLDQTSLVWNKNDRNIYTAHEIAQIVPLVNKQNIYEKFLFLNKWVLGYWPRAVEIRNLILEIGNLNKKRNLTERLTFFIQYLYMKNKITSEIVTPNKAIFHKNNWGKKVLKQLSQH